MASPFSHLPRPSLTEMIADRIKRSIQAGEYRLGDKLPSILEMARDFGVGHPTVRIALTRLEAEGLVRVRHGLGVYIEGRPRIAR